MIEGENLKEFIDDPNVVAFNIAYTPVLINFLKENPCFHIGKIIGDFAIMYGNTNEFSETVLNELFPSRANIYASVLGLLDEQDLEASGIIQVQNQPYLQLRGEGVLLGFVDTGIDYTKEDFQYEDGTTRIKYIWDQSIKGKEPEGFLYGTEFTEEQINEALKSDNPHTIVPHVDTVGHGTFLASVAGGSNIDKKNSAAPNAEFIIVKLKKAGEYYLNRYLVPKNQDNVFESTDLIMGIEYILDKAAQLNKPAAICIGVGTTFDGHDSFSIIELYLTLLAQRTGICICAAAGNESHAKHHTTGKISDEEPTKEIDIRVEEGSESFPVYLWNNPSDRISVSIKSPTGELVGRVPARSGTILKSKLILEESTVVVEYYFPIEQSGSQLTIVKILNPTPGLWKIIAHGDIILEGIYHAWLPLTSLVSKGVEFTEPDPKSTVVIPATAIGIITCGAYNSHDGSLYVNSSMGPTRLPAIAPDLTAPGVNIEAVIPSGSVIMNGTSISAALTTGASALMLEWGIIRKNDFAINTYRIKTYLIRGCQRDPNINYPNIEWGYGKLDLWQTFTRLL